MSYYEDVYLKRLNRFGNDFQSRVQGKREKDFEDYLKKSVYRVDLEIESEKVEATLEPNRQDKSETLAYLLTRRDNIIPNGTIFQAEGLLGMNYWMIYWLESMTASGYNRYTILKMTHLLEWENANGEKKTSWAYFHGKGDAAMKNTVRSGKTEPIYFENQNESFFVMPFTPDIKEDLYLEIPSGKINNIIQAYVVTGYDITSTDGIEYVTVDPVKLRDKTPKPEGEGAEYYWLNGGNE